MSALFKQQTQNLLNALRRTERDQIKIGSEVVGMADGGYCQVQLGNNEFFDLDIGDFLAEVKKMDKAVKDLSDRLVNSLSGKTE